MEEKICSSCFEFRPVNEFKIGHKCILCVANYRYVYGKVIEGWRDREDRKTYSDKGKKCPRCSVFFPLDNFYKRKDGRPDSCCIPCKKECDRLRHRSDRRRNVRS